MKHRFELNALTLTIIFWMIVMAAAIIWVSTTQAQHNPSYSNVTAQHVDAYLRPDALAGVRNRPDGPAKQKNIDAGQNGTRYPLTDTDITYGVLALPTQSWNKQTQAWDFRGLKHIIERAIAAGKRVYLRPFTAVQGTYLAIPEHFKTISATHNGCNRTAVNINDGETWTRLLQYYVAFHDQIIKPYKEHLIGIDATWAGSIDGGQPSYAGHLCGGNLTSVFGFRREKLLEELDFQRDLWGAGMICHLSPNTSDEWVTAYFAAEDCKARRQDSRPYRETRSTNAKAEKYSWSVLLDIYEITGGNLAQWTKQGSRHYDEMTRFYGSDFPGNVERAFIDVRDREGFVWPMSSFPSKAAEPQYWTHYLEGPQGALAYVPGQIEAFYDSWHDGYVPPPDTLPPPIDPPPADSTLLKLIEKNAADIEALYDWHHTAPKQ
jgi:hypothetical protein